MARAYGQDLRDRVIDAGTSARQAAERFGVGVATAIVCARRAREGERSARKRGQPRRSKLDLHREFLLGAIEAEPDITIAEMQQRLKTEAGITASLGFGAGLANLVYNMHRAAWLARQQFMPA